MSTSVASVFWTLLLLTSSFCLGKIQIQNQGVFSIDEHSSLTLVCTSTQTDHANWFVSGQQVFNMTSRYVIVEKQTTVNYFTTNLTILSAEPEDSGTYVCRCSHSGEQDSVNVTVIHHEKHRQVRIDGPLTRHVSIGSTLELICKADIHSSVAWFYDNQNLTVEDRVTQITDEPTHTMTIILVRTNLKSTDFGKYSCHNRRDRDDKASVDVQEMVSGKASNGVAIATLEIMQIIGSILFAINVLQ